MASIGIEIPHQRIVAFCHANGIRRLALFRSVLRDDFTPHSDVDVLVEFQPGVHVGLAFVRLQDELSSILGRQVDLHTPGSLSKYFRTEVLREDAVTLRQMLDHVEEAISLVDGRTRQDLESDRMFFLALLKLVEIRSILSWRRIGCAILISRRDVSDQEPDLGPCDIR